MRPVLRQVIQFHHLFDGTLDLEQVAMANDALDVADENELRAREVEE